MEFFFLVWFWTLTTATVSAMSAHMHHRNWPDLCGPVYKTRAFFFFLSLIFSPVFPDGFIYLQPWSKNCSSFDVIQTRAAVYVSLIILTGFNIYRGQFILLPIMDVGSCLCLTSWINKAVNEKSVCFLLLLPTALTLVHHVLRQKQFYVKIIHLISDLFIFLLFASSTNAKANK